MVYYSLLNSYASYQFWFKVLAMLCVMVALYLIAPFGLRRLKFKKNEMRAGGLNRLERRSRQATGKNNKSNKKHF